MNMDARETEILAQMEAEFAWSDAPFAERIANGPRLSIAYRLWLVMATAVGIGLVMMFALHIVFAVAGYLVLIAAGTSILQHRRLTPAERPPIETFHRLTADLFRSTGTTVEITD
jgi:hypothetical protein